MWLLPSYSLLLCRWLLHPKPAVLAGLDQVMVPTAHCNIVCVVSTILLTVILCRWFLPYYSLWYCAGGFYPTTHCDIVQVVSTLLLTVILCRWLLHPEPAILAGLDQVPVLPALLFPFSHGSGVHQRAAYPMRRFPQRLTVCTVPDAECYPCLLTGCPELLWHRSVLLALFSAAFFVHRCFSPSWIPGTSVCLRAQVCVTMHHTDFLMGTHICEMSYACSVLCIGNTLWDVLHL